MQILVMSDTHGRYDILRELILSHWRADLFIHCGDGEYEVENFRSDYPDLAPRLIAVRGNCDYGSELPLRETVPLPYGHKAVVVHGHLQLRGDFEENMIRLAQSQQADLVFFGHFHQRVETFTDGITFFSPGSAARPRDGLPPSFGLVDVLPSGILTSHGDVKMTD